MTAPDLFERALRKNNSLEVARLLDAGRNVAERLEFGRTPLHLAAESGSVECAEVLIRRGATLEACANDGSTALIAALSAGEARVAERLLAAGAVLHYFCGLEDTPETRQKLRSFAEGIATLSGKSSQPWNQPINALLQDEIRSVLDRTLPDLVVSMAMQPQEFHAVHFCKNLESLEVLSRQPGNSFDIHDGAGGWPLKSFTESGDATVVAWLLKQGADPNFTSTGHSALHSAVADNHLDCARILLNAGANPNQQDVDGCVPMWQVGSDAMLDLLLAHGADPRIADQCDSKPSYWVKIPALKARLLALETQQ